MKRGRLLKILRTLVVTLTPGAMILATPTAHAQPGTVLSHQKISDTDGGFTGILDDVDLFGNSAASLGDLDGDGVGDLAVGAVLDDDGGFDHGAVWVLYREAQQSYSTIVLGDAIHSRANMPIGPP